MEVIQKEKKKHEKKMRTVQEISEITFALQWSQKKREKGTKNTFDEIIAEDFPNLRKETDI